ncbi:short-chain dehydrogenase/reductase SDR [Fomitiporia mediterranea MF3/22]|uniref:short-chain dehydrogenase/reductase SDR n=1 Tax=Fomitiporia mediterranea (strain MF3/22) TaxID=694068 RepID=UPI00044092D7|nr:short-chain dehydrogenase/reductase SDR [Fomitiporia mediterranea MF3/22]EJD00012.1 short-chain dehydrogenase/reductase SDR [Fomitiporia mediterranea MF3/22]
MTPTVRIRTLFNLPQRVASLQHSTRFSRVNWTSTSSYQLKKQFAKMASQNARPILVVAGVGNGSGTGASTARVFAKEGYRVALIARNADHLKKTADEINAAGGVAAPFPVATYDAASLTSAFNSIKGQWPDSRLRVAVWNAGYGIWKPFLQITDEEVAEALNTNVRAAFAFSRLAITAFKENDLNDVGKRGALIFTGATAAWRGNTTTSAFAAGKFGLRALSQSLNKEFGKDNIHVSHSIIDGVILTDRVRSYRNDKDWENEDIRLNPDSIAKSYLYLVNQDRTAWTWELDLRPAHEKW